MDANTLLLLCPTDLVNAIFRDWITIYDLCGLDCAITANALRPAYLRHISEWIGPITSRSVVIHKNSVETLRWFKSRDAYADSYVFETNVTHEILSMVTAKMVTHIKSLEFDTYSVRTLDRSCIMACSQITHLSLTERDPLHSSLDEANLEAIFQHCSKIEHLTLSFIMDITKNIYPIIGRCLTQLRHLSIVACPHVSIEESFASEILPHLPPLLETLQTDLSIHSDSVLPQRHPNIAPSLRSLEANLGVCLEVCAVCPHLRDLSITKISSSNLERDLFTLQGLVSQMKLASLSVAGVPRGAAPFHPRLWTAISTLRVLSFTGPLRRADWSASFHELHGLTSLSLDVTNDREDAEEVDLVGAVCENNTSLSQLIVRHAGYVRSEALFALPDLKVLDLSWAEMSAEFLHRVGEMKQLEDLALAGVGAISEAVLSQLLAALPMLRKLNVSHCLLSSHSLVQILTSWGRKLTEVRAVDVLQTRSHVEEVFLQCPMLEGLDADRSLTISDWEVVQCSVRAKYPGRLIVSLID